VSRPRTHHPFLEAFKLHVTYSNCLVYRLMSFGADDLGTQTALDIRSECVATSGFDGLHVYVSYASGDETAEQIWGTEKLPRLAGLKKQWDPDNVFAYNHALPTHYP